MARRYERSGEAKGERAQKKKRAEKENGNCWNEEKEIGGRKEAAGNTNGSVGGGFHRKSPGG
jgi:hypothetical protein